MPVFLDATSQTQGQVLIVEFTVTRAAPGVPGFIGDRVPVAKPAPVAPLLLVWHMATPAVRPSAGPRSRRPAITEPLERLVGGRLAEKPPPVEPRVSQFAQLVFPECRAGARKQRTGRAVHDALLERYRATISSLVRREDGRDKGKLSS